MKKVYILLLVLFIVSCCRNDNRGKLYNFEQALKTGRFTKVNFYMWGGSVTINKWIDEYVAAGVKEKYGIKLKRIPMDASVFVNKLITEKQAHKYRGTIDLLWINGENFKNSYEAGLLYGPFADQLPNYINLVDQAAVKYDFGYPTNQFEAPYGRAQFVFELDSAKYSAPKNLLELKQWIIDNPGKFTYPQPPDFTGSAFIRQMFYAVTGGADQYLSGYDEKLYQENSAILWEFLNEIKPYLWQKGETYPQNSAALDLLFQRGEVGINMSYHQANASNKILQGLYPQTVRSFVLEEGSIFNTHFTAIPFNAPNVPGAMLVANFLLEPSTQLDKNDPKNWGDFTALDISKLSSADQTKFAELDLGESTLPLETLSKYAVPEIPSDYLLQLEQDWTKHVLGK